MEKLDYKKEYKDLYMPKNKPVLVEVPKMQFIMIDGSGDPNSENYQNAIGALYGIAFTIKMSKMQGKQPLRYFEYVVPPLEGLWWCNNGGFDFDKRDNWLWTSMIRQPEFVTPDFFTWALSEASNKKPHIDFSKVRFETFEEGLCVQMMHIGPYKTEPETVNAIREFMKTNRYADETGSNRKHHEIYLSDPRKTVPQKLKTVIRHPVCKI